MTRALLALLVVVVAGCETSHADTRSRPPDGGRPLVVPASNSPSTPTVAPAPPPADPAPSSTSVGSPNDGRLVAGVPVPSTGLGFKLNERRINVDSFFGTTELVGAIARAAEVVEHEQPSSTLVINDLSFPGGGPIPHHGSHQAGRDADILFYLTDLRGRPVASRGVVIEPDGTGTDFKDLADPADDEQVELDVRRTWRLVRAMVEDPDALVQRIFVAEHVRTMLLAEAERVRAPRRAKDRAGDAMCQPGTPHDDHLHIRLFCTVEDMRAGCLDGNPMYPWRRLELRAAGILEPMMATGRRRRAEPAETTPAAATPPEPRPHRLVKALLERRRGWSRTPHPGRPWCN
ncbi:MAG: penicillin-insensitive murein endopeptidase [Deltaproteobacteria bacterium]|nr:penicillin-insensitive murein endopeptidase [Deltaproteobacteria bacterium]